MSDQDVNAEPPAERADDANDRVNAPKPEAAGDDTDSAFRVAVAALNTWVEGLNGIQNPPFVRGTIFPDTEWTRLFRLVAITTALAGALAVGHSVAPAVFKPTVDSQSLEEVTVFACFGIIYSTYARFWPFRIKISARQSLFCFALVLIPYFPFFILLKSVGDKISIVWFIFICALSAHVFVLTVRAIATVTGAAYWKVILSLLVGLALALLAVIPTPHYTNPNASQPPSAAAPPSGSALKP